MNMNFTSQSRFSAFLGLFLLLNLTTTALAQSGLSVRPTVSPFLNGSMPTTTSGQIPALLSQTGAFTNTPNLVPGSSLIPYAVNSPFWSDAAEKSRFVAVPSDGAPYSASEVVTFSETGEWTFPQGSVFVKHFELVIDKQTGAKRRLETRLLVRDELGGVYGRSYRWRPDGTDADVVPTAQTEVIQIVDANGSTSNQTWLYPSPTDCLQCHNTFSKGVLGANARQLNGSLTYPTTGISANQLATWSSIGMFDRQLTTSEIGQLRRLVPITDTTADLETRVRSYLDSNCSSCHRGQGQGPGPLFNARFDTPVDQQNLFNGALEKNSLANSSIHVRMTSLTQPMPPVGRNVVHAEAAAVLAQWINYPFELVQAYATGRPRELRASFSRAVDPVTATDILRFSLPGKTIVAAKLEDDGATVTLRTAQNLDPNTSYSVAARGVKEKVAPQNAVWPQTEKSFTPPTISTQTRIADVVFKNTTGGTGFATVLVDPASSQMSWVLAATSALSSNMTNSDFHGPAIPGQSAPVIFAVPTSLGSSTGTRALSSAQLAQILNDSWYLNIKTSANPAGELLGQIHPRVLERGGVCPL
jgi:hypothetical protein